MNTTKLKDAIIEMKHQRAALNSAIEQLEKVLSALNGGGEAQEQPLTDRSVHQGEDITIPDCGIKILESNGRPMHITDIAAKASTLLGREISRGSMESSFKRRIESAKKKNTRPEVKKVRRGIFGLTQWAETDSPDSPATE